MRQNTLILSVMMPLKKREHEMTTLVFNKNSWHYKLNSFCGHNLNYVSVCRYFWKTCGSLLTIVLAGLATFMFFAFLALVLSAPLLQFYFFVPLPIVAGCAGIWITILIFVLSLMLEDIRYVSEENRPWWGKTILRTNTQRRQSSGLLRAWLRAKKYKVCPIIEWRQ